MDFDDIAFCQQYFQKEDKDPTLTEIRLIDTYWSDHCRHTTFLTTLEQPQIEADYIQASYDKYLHIREELGRSQKPICLMDLATVAARWLKTWTNPRRSTPAPYVCKRKSTAKPRIGC